MAHDAAKSEQAFDWSDPHHFHHGADAQHDEHEGHHVTSWQWLVTILFILLGLTALTVASAEIERWLIGLGVNISHFWNVVIALFIATIKATLVCMYFMHLKHDNPINTMILLTTIFVFGLFLLFTGIDIAERDAVNKWKAPYATAGGTGVGITKGGVFGPGTVLGDPITWHVKQTRINAYAEEIAEKKGHTNEAGEPVPTEDDLFEAQKKFWTSYYNKKLEGHPDHLPPQHPRDRANDDPRDGMLQQAAIYPMWVTAHIEHHPHHEVSNANQTVPRTGATRGLFDHADGDEGHGTDAQADPAHGDH